MPRITLLLLAVCLVAGCEYHDMKEMMAPTEPPAELKQLERFVGTWSGTAEIVAPTAEEMAEMFPEEEAGAEPAPMKGGDTTKWVLGGRFLMTEGWYEMPGGECANYLSLMTWDPRAKKFRSWHFSDSGEFSEGTATLDAEGTTMQMKAKSVNPRGKKMCGAGEVTFSGQDAMEWTWAEGDLMHKNMKFKGTSKRQR